ncbi:MAG: hypothetical protein ACPKPY_12515 [Nitrososphaeraceae archaeon]
MLILVLNIHYLETIYAWYNIKNIITYYNHFEISNIDKNWYHENQVKFEIYNDSSNIKTDFMGLNYTISEFSTGSHSFLFYPIYNKQNNSIWISDILPNSGRIFEFNIEKNKFTVHNISNTDIITLLTFDKTNSNILWYIDPIQNIIGKYNIVSHELNQYENPLDDIITGITTDNNQNLWMSIMKSNKIIKFDQLNKTFVEFDIPTSNSLPSNIIYDEIRNCIWFVELKGQFGKLDLNTEEIIEYPNKFTDSSDTQILGEPVFIFLNPNDLNIYISDHKNNNIISFDPSTETFKVYSLKVKNGLAFGITSNNNGNLWIAQHITNSIAILDPKTGENIQVDIPKGSLVQYVITDKNDNIWFVNQQIDGLSSINIKKNIYL